MLLLWQSSSYCSASLGLSPCSLLKFLASNNFMSHTERHLQRALSTTRRNKFNHNLSKLLDFVLELQKPSAAKSIFCNSKCGRSPTQPTHKGDRPLTERWLHAYSTFSRMVRISTAYTGGSDKLRRPRNLAQPYRNRNCRPCSPTNIRRYHQQLRRRKVISHSRTWQKRIETWTLLR